MDLRGVSQNWNEFGKQDPFWAILTNEKCRGNRWNVEEFFETGRSEVRRLLADLHQLDVEVRRKRALDFGCGVGRLTQALCEHFEQCAGVDIAPSMISRAEQYNKFGRHCQYYLNQLSAAGPSAVSRQLSAGQAGSLHHNGNPLLEPKKMAELEERTQHAP